MLHGLDVLFSLEGDVDPIAYGSPYATGPLSCPVCPVCNVGVLCSNGWVALGAEVGLGPGHIVLDGDAASPPHGKVHSNPHFRGFFFTAES